MLFGSYSFAESIPQEAYVAAQKSLELEKTWTKKTIGEYTGLFKLGSASASDFQSATLGDGYVVCAISYKELLALKSGSEILSHAVFSNYAFPILVKGNPVGHITIHKDRKTEKIIEHGGASGSGKTAELIYELQGKDAELKNCIFSEIWVDYWDKYVVVSKDKELYIAPVEAKTDQAQLLKSMCSPDNGLLAIEKALPILRDYAEKKEIRVEEFKEWQKHTKQ
jgi:hypothetical protein